MYINHHKAIGHTSFDVTIASPSNWSPATAATLFLGSKKRDRASEAPIVLDGVAALAVATTTKNMVSVRIVW